MNKVTENNEPFDILDELENGTDVILRSDQPVVVYLDGIRFRHVTRNLDKPFDERFHDAMLETARRMSHHFMLNFAVVASDKFALVRFNKDERMSIWCGQSRDRILSSVSSMASVILMETCRRMDVDLALFPSFAGHVMNAIDKDEAASILVALEQRHRNKSVSHLVHHVLGSQKEKLKVSELKQKLSEAGAPWDGMPAKYKHGSAIRREPSKNGDMKFFIKSIPQPLFYRENLVADIFYGNSGD